MRYPNEHSEAFEATLSTERRDLLRRIRANRSGRPRYAVQYEFFSTAPISELVALVAEHEKEIGRKKTEADSEKRAESARYRGAMRVELDVGDRRRQHLAGKNVWLYHGTSSRFLPRIRRFGLVPNAPQQTHHDTTPGYVYLTADEGFGRSGAEFYAREAAGKFGGRPIVLRVRVPWDDLERDEDDADLRVGANQYRLATSVSPGDIVEER